MDEVLETRGKLRVRLVLDEYPEKPYDDGRSPIIRLDYLSGWRAEAVSDIGGYVPAAIDSITAAAARWGGEPDLFERYLRIFHGTTEVEWYDRRGGGGSVYVTFDTTDWREHHGINDGRTGAIDIGEWRAWCEGDVYGYVVEELATWRRTDNESGDERQTWEERESLWGLYGREYAEQSAREGFSA